MTFRSGRTQTAVRSPSHSVIFYARRIGPTRKSRASRARLRVLLLYRHSWGAVDRLTRGGMRCGDTLLIPARGSGVTSHLWIIVTEPAPDTHKCVIVSVTTLRQNKDQTVTLG